MAISGLSAENRMLLSRLHQVFEGPFTIVEASEAMGLELSRVSRLLRHLAAQGWLVRVRRGLYATVPLGAERPQEWSADPWAVAARARSRVHRWLERAPPLGSDGAAVRLDGLLHGAAGGPPAGVDRWHTVRASAQERFVALRNSPRLAVRGAGAGLRSRADARRLPRRSDGGRGCAMWSMPSVPTPVGRVRAGR